LLLNPEIDEVEKHFYFLPNGEIKHLTKEGEETLNVCQLNRIELSKARQEITDEIIRKIIDIFVNYSQQSHYDMLTQLWRDKITYNQATEYSRFRYFIAHFFNYFIVDKLVEIGLTEYAIIVEQHFNEFKTTSK